MSLQKLSNINKILLKNTDLKDKVNKLFILFRGSLKNVIGKNKLDDSIYKLIYVLSELSFTYLLDRDTFSSLENPQPTPGGFKDEFSILLQKDTGFSSLAKDNFDVEKFQNCKFFPIHYIYQMGYKKNEELELLGDKIVNLLDMYNILYNFPDFNPLLWTTELYLYFMTYKMILWISEVVDVGSEENEKQYKDNIVIPGFQIYIIGCINRILCKDKDKHIYNIPYFNGEMDPDFKFNGQLEKEVVGKKEEEEEEEEEGKEKEEDTKEDNNEEKKDTEKDKEKEEESIGDELK